ncbi:MAG: phosphoribosylformylglycinamidine cyclo-ligase [Candidatus Omnitrophota bacterium]|nr:phosphoribosylformylglycinamidine cyclo-ligase [Candidatus Omnitrophota bacterium]
MTYKRSGVDIDKADMLVKDARRLINSTRIKGSVGSIGGFGGFFDTALSGVKNPLLVSSTDGVGTKLKVAQLVGKHDTVGIDLVAMCVNDVLCCGARPVFFLDYFATGKLDERTWSDVIKGIVKGCRQAGCALLGGETAELPGMYRKGEYDLAGFTVGMVDRRRIIDGRKIRPGDVMLGLASSGLHSNGYSLVRKIFTKNEIRKEKELFLKPTLIYVKPLLEISREVRVKGAANITGGGFYDNIPRMLPKDVKAVVREGSWRVPRIFDLILKRAKIEKVELYRTFNMGIGMALVLSRKDAEKAQKILGRKFKLKSWVIGGIAGGRKGVKIV